MAKSSLRMVSLLITILLVDHNFSQNVLNSTALYSKYTQGSQITIGDLVIVKGKASDNIAYSIDFVIGSDIAFHFNPRFEENVIVRNSMVNNDWETEMIDGGWLISSNFQDLINFEFEFTSTHWEVSYFNERIPIYDFPHRLNGFITDITTSSITNPSIWINKTSQRTTSNAPTVMPTAIPTATPICCHVDAIAPTTTLSLTNIPSSMHMTTDMIDALTTLSPINISSSITPYMTYMIVALMILIPAFIICVAFCFHQTRPGTDRPSYVALFICFWSIGDFYTDVIWTLTLYNHRKNSNLFVFAFCFTFGSHLISIIIGLTYITIWRQTRSNLHLIDYVLQYNKFLIFSTLIAGFYATQRMITSHLFHFNVFSFQMSNKQTKQISILKIINNVFLENIPAFIIQYLYLVTTSNETNSRSIFNIIGIDVKNGINSACLLAMLFSAVAILFAVLRLIVDLFNGCVDMFRENRNNGLNKICFEFCFKSPTTNSFKRYHIHTKYLLSNAIRLAFHIQISQIEIIQIQQITCGIKVNAILKYLNDKNAQQILNGLSDKQNAIYFSFYNECANQLHIHSPQIILDVLQINFIPKNGKKKNIIGNIHSERHDHVQKFKQLQISIEMNDTWTDYH